MQVRKALIRSRGGHKADSSTQVLNSTGNGLIVHKTSQAAIVATKAVLEYRSPGTSRESRPTSEGDTEAVRVEHESASDAAGLALDQRTRQHVASERRRRIPPPPDSSRSPQAPIEV